MTTNDPLAHEPSNSYPAASNGEPAWGTVPTGPAPGFGSDGGPSNIPTGPAACRPRPTAPDVERFFDQIRSLGIVRPDPGQGRRLAGVAAGIARRYGIEPVAVRIAAVVLALLGGAGILLYGLGWLFLPHPDGRIHAQQVLSGTVTAGFVGAVLTVLAMVHGSVPLLLAGLVMWLIVRSRRGHRAQAC